MASALPNLTGEDDDLSRPDTPLASQIPPPPIITPESSTADQSPGPSSLSAQSPSSTDSHSSHFLLPIPTPPTNKSQSSFTFSDVVDGTNASDPLSPEIASADISVAPDLSFVETSSAPAARELKRRYDQHIGVGKDFRSPYAIIAFVNQHGKQMFRVGHRDLSAPGASAADAERASQSKSPSESSHAPPRTKRRSRMSMHAFLPPSMFRNGSTSARPQTSAGAPRKLRKTRSIPDMYGGLAGLSGPSVAASPPQGTASAVTGRAHSQSVTAADMPRFTTINVPYPKPRGDMFGEVMDWLSPSSSASNSYSTQSLFLPGEASTSKYEHRTTPAIIEHPFGHGVSFDSPSRRPNDFLPTPRLLREMHSLESVMTAKQMTPQSSSSFRGERASEVPSEASSNESDRPPSAIRMRMSATSIAEVPPEPEFLPSPETSMHSRYSTDVFDVLQTYRGLPLLDKLSPDSEETTVIKISLSADDTAAPRDDPRFVIWGEIQVEQDDELSQGSYPDVPSARSSTMSRKRSTKGVKGKAPELPSLRLSSGEGTRKVLVAATIERWIAQLTSDLNYDELLIFFLTYRTYISAVDLCHLLICRFHWALMQHTSTHDEVVRRIVRVRTFVAIRYWLLTFFTVDFLPNRELRLLVANWLNTLIRDPILTKHNDGLSIVRKLKKVVKDCKKAHTRSPTQPKSRPPAVKQTPSKQDHVLGEKFAEATQKLNKDDEDSDIDLDFVADEGPAPDVSTGFQSDPVNAHLSAAHVGAGLSPARPSSLPLSSLSILQQTNRASLPGSDSDIPFVQTSATLPIHHNALSRVFVKTIGRLGRWKRVLNSRSAGRTPLGACADVSAFDLELTVSRDLLTVNGGVEQYLKMIEQQQRPSIASQGTPPSYDEGTVTASTSIPLDGPPPDSSEPTPDITASTEQPEIPAESVVERPEEQVIETPALDEHDDPELSDRPVSWRSTSTDSFGVPITGSAAAFPPPEHSPWQFDVVSIDELDLSDTSSDDHVGGPPAPPGLRKVPRRLPLRRDFEFIRRSESVSSMGITSRDSVASASSALSSSSFTGLGGNIHQWQMNALVDSLSNDEETGDVEAALRRLEGQINPQKQQEKAWKVDGWVRTIRERMAAGDYGDDQPRFSDDEDDDDDDDDDDDHSSDNIDDTGRPSSWSGHNEDLIFPTNISPQADSLSPQESSADHAASELAVTPIATQTSYNIPGPPGPSSPKRASEAKPSPEDAVPLEILQSRVSTTHRPSLSSKFGNPEAPRVHRSFILGYRAEVLVGHFSLIDRELFMGVKFEELVLDDWMACEEVNVLDWAQYLKDRARWRAESRCTDKTTALATVRARFNMIANFVISEVALTQPGERALVVGKFIRIAWKAYSSSNFSTLVPIITGLRSEWVTKAMRRSWNRVGMWETRMFNDLKMFTTNVDDFRYIRQAIEAIVDAKPLDVGSYATSVISGGGTDKSRSVSDVKPPLASACIPFIGVYLSQLHRFSRLPDLIDPTAPNEAVGVDPLTSNFNALAHPEVFSTLAPLPPSMHLEPLVNVHKQRKIAGVIKSLVEGQHLASRVQFPLDKKLYQKCLKLRGLDSDTLERALAMYEV